jgi:cobalt-zinc-cadmium efflux system outer membrane protein
MRRQTTFMFVLALTAAAHAAAQTSSADRHLDPISGLSLTDAVERALAKEPSIGAARLELDAAGGRQRQAALRPNPMASFERRAEPAGSDRLTMVGVEWPLDLFRRGARITVADRERAGAERGLEDRERLLAADVRNRYGAVLAAVRDLQILEALVQTTTDQRDLLRSRVEAGATPPLDRDLVEVELGRIDAERLLQAGRTEAALIELKRLLGMEPVDPLRLRQDFERLVQEESARPSDPARDAALVDRRADVQQAMALVDAADARADLARRNGRFDVALFGAYMRMDAGFPQFGFSADGGLERVRGVMQYVSAGARVTLPVLNRGQGDVQAAQAERAAALASHAAASLQARSEIAIARAADDAARQAVAIYSTGRRALAGQNLEVVRQSYGLGRVTVFEVLDEQRRWLEIERAYTDALRAAYEARTALARALGER